jgi:RNA polymerase sigma-70 factor (ECF subfamily)
VQSDEDAADLTQRVFLQALDALPKYQERGSPFAAWLFRIARNAAYDTRRRRRATIPWQAVPETLHPLDTQDSEQEMLRQEGIEELKTLLTTLDPQQRELVALRFDAELTLGEIAQVIGTSQATVQRRMARLLQTLKEHDVEQ